MFNIQRKRRSIESDRHHIDDGIDLSRNRIVVVFSWIRRAVILFFGAMLAVWIISLIALGFELTKDPSVFLPIVIYAILHGAILLALAFVAISVISHAIKTRTSFSRYRVKMMALALVLLVSLFLLDCLMPIQGSFELLGGAIYIDVNDPTSNPIIDVNLGLLFFLLVVAATIVDYRYGMLLQQLEDETV